MLSLHILWALGLLISQILYTEARVGGGYLEPVALDDQEVKSLSVWAATRLKGTLLQVKAAQRQVVAGWLYHIDLQMKNKHEQVVNCSVKVWIRHWINSIRLVKATCRPRST